MWNAWARVRECPACIRRRTICARSCCAWRCAIRGARRSSGSPPNCAAHHQWSSRLGRLRQRPGDGAPGVCLLAGARAARTRDADDRGAKGRRLARRGDLRRRRAWRRNRPGRAGIKTAEIGNRSRPENRAASSSPGQSSLFSQALLRKIAGAFAGAKGDDGTCGGVQATTAPQQFSFSEPPRR